MNDIKYTATHEWIEVVDSEGIVGITERAQLEYGEVVFVELPAIGDEYEQDEIMGRLENANGHTFAFHAPVTGEIREVNAALEDDPELINHSPEGDGWICRISIESARELDILMDAKAYDKYEEEELDEEYEDDDDFFDDDEDY